ncbi:hemin ABC transporter substrate-binding protein [Noviherbaspirillum cavernae]|uniref:Hemin ABC transporter substrate-binding protein n=1 Tax=Noviherbaspirillum cavernae TaxID=2320862 RepID=A0A418WX74_9BURK|nr:hemin ABC transporter substrate-binding protein [Noviherbaspirillum cavernae]RJG04713.1 hemin ABC transporter substrate-binding protein [Noviherbaspirillum cavernae]
MRRLSFNAQRRTRLCQLSMLALAGSLGGWSSGIAAGRNGQNRIVSVGGALTEIIYALQAQGDLVGVDTTSIYPESASKLPNVGYSRALSAEGVLALAPTQVIATEDAGPPAVLRQITAAGVPVTVLPANHRFEGLIERVLRVGELTGRKAQAEQYAADLRQEWARVRKQIDARRGKPVKVLFVLAHAPGQIMVAGQDTSADAVLRYAGAVNAIGGITGYKPLTPEAVIGAQPDVVLLTDQGLKAQGGTASVLALPGIAQTPAGRNKRVIGLDAMYLLGFGPRLPAAVTALDAALTRAMTA